MIPRILQHLKIDALNEMQLAAIESSQKSNDLILLSPTGSGKTLAFLLPLVQNLSDEIKSVQAIIIVPSRELALQIEQVFKSMQTGFKVTCCYGGHKVRTEENTLLEAPAVLVGTPGRLLFHLKNKHVTTDKIKTLVLDEFDKSLELGFQQEMGSILELLPNIRKRFLTSATSIDTIPEFTGLKNPVRINFLKDEPPKDLVLKKVISAENDKLEALFRLICHIGNRPALVFCNHRDAVDRISELLGRQGIIHSVFHGKLEQDERERALIKLRNGTAHLLISTDLASRGLDIPEIEYVIHYQLPPNEQAFTHRNGRTARMHAKGTAYLILREDEDLPSFIKTKPLVQELAEKLSLPQRSEWTTLYISVGKKDKVSKTDIVGLLLQKGGLAKEELGKIEVLDHASFAAIKEAKLKSVLKVLEGEKIKKKQVKIDLAR
jgi:superfamily II DNA/RNA helicase